MSSGGAGLFPAPRPSGSLPDLLPIPDRLRRTIWLRQLWRFHPWPAHVATWVCKKLSSPEVWPKIWYCLAFSALRGTYPVSRAHRLLGVLGPPGSPEYAASLFFRPSSSRAPLWWALASREPTPPLSLSSESPVASVNQDLTPLLVWCVDHDLELAGRFLGYDFLIACLRAGNRETFAWGLAQGLPPDGSEEVEPEEYQGFRCSPIESDLRTPLWHAVDLSTLSDPWWIDQLLAAGGRWDYPGEGGTSAADLDRERAIGWSAWWKKNKLLQHLTPPPLPDAPRRM